MQRERSNSDRRLQKEMARRSKERVLREAWAAAQADAVHWADAQAARDEERAAQMRAAEAAQAMHAQRLATEKEARVRERGRLSVGRALPLTARHASTLARLSSPKKAPRCACGVAWLLLQVAAQQELARVAELKAARLAAQEARAAAARARQLEAEVRLLLSWVAPLRVSVSQSGGC
jgi:hypothetical protein